jgi:hypothetical protein
MTAVSCRWHANCDNKREGLSRGISMNNFMIVKQRVSKGSPQSGGQRAVTRPPVRFLVAASHVPAR